MAARVPQVRPEPSTALILAGDPVLSHTWTELALLANYIRGTGASLIPGCFPESVVSAGGTEVFTFRTKTRDSAIQRIWIITLSATTSGASAIIRAPASSGTPSGSRGVGIDPDAPNDIVYVEDLASKATSEVSFNIDIQAAGQTVTVDRIECYEQTRPILTLDNVDWGVDLVTLRPRAPIYDAANRTPAGVMDAYENADARRVGGLQWAVRTGEATTISTSTFTASGVHFALEMPLIGRKVFDGDTTQTWNWSVYAEVDSGATGEVEVVNGATSNLDTITVTSTSGYAWVTAGTFVSDAEDLSLTDGIRGGTWGNGTSINFRARRATATSGSVRIASISVWDASGT